MLELIILSTLMNGPCHGYLFKAYRGISVNNNTIYPLLRKLADKGYIRSELVLQDDRPAKKVYEITEAGKGRLQDILEDFDSTKALSDDEFYLRVAYFHLLDSKTICKIIDARVEALDRMESVSIFEEVLSGSLDKNGDRAALKNFIHSQHTAEKEFLASLRAKYEAGK